MKNVFTFFCSTSKKTTHNYIMLKRLRSYLCKQILIQRRITFVITPQSVLCAIVALKNFKKMSTIFYLTSEGWNRYQQTYKQVTFHKAYCCGKKRRRARRRAPIQSREFQGDLLQEHLLGIKGSFVCQGSGWQWCQIEAIAVERVSEKGHKASRVVVDGKPKISSQ